MLNFGNILGCKALRLSFGRPAFLGVPETGSSEQGSGTTQRAFAIQLVTRQKSGNLHPDGTQGGHVFSIKQGHADGMIFATGF
ncbi:hypothetical protein J7443_14305 [Tropicibacter sp. R15_0]|uniref:hypothetical protein n=1 Tax=Tropicibacter sp. R15_0 TaxID=2821101 RepID=UPI001ADBBE66|nr:hypothetical protein [Tropicibacter sp. R15_0]MBO9466412.1 hypothetical protein [Tropicibacter sp. R15_0]